jgi:hypothetical protein
MEFFLSFSHILMKSEINNEFHPLTCHEGPEEE